uniref:Uncharacterized protein n=1 Tax=Rhizophora mucronata TaxID=61149 RepID=A0A2P2PLU3_RHIMU
MPYLEEDFMFSSLPKLKNQIPVSLSILLHVKQIKGKISSLRSHLT